MILLPLTTVSHTDHLRTWLTAWRRGQKVTMVAWPVYLAKLNRDILCLLGMVCFVSWSSRVSPSEYNVAWKRTVEDYHRRSFIVDVVQGHGLAYMLKNLVLSVTRSQLASITRMLRGFAHGTGI